MTAAAEGEGPSKSRSFFFSAVILAASLLILFRSIPIDLDYAKRLSVSHGSGFLPLVALAGVVALGGLWFLSRRSPRTTVIALAAVCAALLVSSDNLVAAGAAGLILAVTFILGDLVFRLLVGSEANSQDVFSAFAAGVAAAGVLLLVLGEGVLLRADVLGVAGAALAIARLRRVARLIGMVRESLRRSEIKSRRPHETLWLSIVLLVLLSSFVSSLGPEVTYDALAYHLPEARDTALHGRVEPLPDVLPQTLFWRNYQTFLAAGYLFGGERVVRLIHFGVGLSVFGVTVALLRRVSQRPPSALVLLALVAVPMICLQLHSIWADWPAALFVTAAAAEIAGNGADAGRLRLAGLLFGAAVATKVFALLALPALLLLWWRRRGPGWVWAFLSATAFTLVVLLPWLAWSQSRSWLAPDAPPFSALVRHATNASVSVASNLLASPGTVQRADSPSLLHLLRLPYDLTFHGSRWEGIANGYNGMLPLLLLLGAVGRKARSLAFVVAAALAAVIPWYLLYAPSVRYLFPVYPLYAVFATEGLDRLTGRFRGWPGSVAALALGAVTLAFPGQFISLPFDARVAIGRIPREEASQTYLPSYPFWRFIAPKDHVLLVGEFDRYHCPAERAWRTGWFPIGDWGSDPERWKRGLRELKISYCVVRADYGGSLPLSESYFDLVERRGVASLYRVHAERLTDSASSGGSRGAKRDR